MCVSVFALNGFCCCFQSGSNDGFCVGLVKFAPTSQTASAACNPNLSSLSTYSLLSVAWHLHLHPMVAAGLDVYTNEFCRRRKMQRDGKRSVNFMRWVVIFLYKLPLKCATVRCKSPPFSAVVGDLNCVSVYIRL